jgi:hypothetical protein
MRFVTLSIYGAIDQPTSGSSGIKLTEGVVFPVEVWWFDRDLIRGALPDRYNKDVRTNMPEALISTSAGSAYGCADIRNDLLTGPGGGAILIPWRDLSKSKLFKHEEVDYGDDTNHACLITRASLQLRESDDGDGDGDHYEIVPELDKNIRKQSVFMRIISDRLLFHEPTETGFSESRIEKERSTGRVISRECCVIGAGQHVTYVLHIPSDRRKSEPKCNVRIMFDGERVSWKIDDREIQFPPEPIEIIP